MHFFSSCIVIKFASSHFIVPPFTDGSNNFLLRKCCPFDFSLTDRLSSLGKPLFFFLRHEFHDIVDRAIQRFAYLPEDFR